MDGGCRSVRCCWVFALDFGWDKMVLEFFFLVSQLGTEMIWVRVLSNGGMLILGCSGVGVRLLFGAAVCGNPRNFWVCG